MSFEQAYIDLISRRRQGDIIYFAPEESKFTDLCIAYASSGRFGCPIMKFNVSGKNDMIFVMEDGSFSPHYPVRVGDSVYKAGYMVEKHKLLLDPCFAYVIM